MDSKGRVLQKAVKEARYTGTETCAEVSDIAKELFEDLDFVGMRIGQTYGDLVTTFGPDNLSEYMRKRAKKPGSTVLYLVTEENASTPAPKKKKSRQQAPQQTTTEESGSERDIPSTASATCKEVQQIDPKKIKKLDKLGQGSQAVVFKGSWEGTLVALKICEFDCDADKQTITKAIADEASVHYGLHHPNVLHLYGLSVSGNSVTLVSELMETSLAQVMDLEEDMSRQMKLNIFCQVAQGLTYFHHNDVVHGDIKPLNILFSNGVQVAKLCDFGLSRFKYDQKATKVEDDFQGTDMYVAPEMHIKGLKCTKASDLWAFGATLIEVFADEDFWEVEANTPSFVVAIVRHMRKRKELQGLRALYGKDEDVYNVASLCQLRPVVTHNRA